MLSNFLLPSPSPCFLFYTIKLSLHGSVGRRREKATKPKRKGRKEDGGKALSPLFRYSAI